MFQNTEARVTRINLAAVLASARNLIFAIGFLLTTGPVIAIPCPNYVNYHTTCGQAKSPPKCDNCPCPPGGGGGAAGGGGGTGAPSDTPSSGCQSCGTQ